MSGLLRLVALCGPIGSGKSTAARHLCETHGYARTRFADPLKAMLRAVGLTDRHLDGDLKAAPCELLGGQSPRHALQTLGTEWGRDMIHPDLWTMLWLRQAQPLLDAGRRVVVDDLRFPNEAALVRVLGGCILRLDTPTASRAAHASERHAIDPHAVVFNEGQSLDVLHARLDGALERLAAA